MALGQTHVLQYEYPQAAAEFREAIRLEPDNGFAWDQLSWALGYEQPPEALEAEKAAREAVRLAPSLPQAQYHLGRALLLQKRYEEAAAAFRRSNDLGGNLGSTGMALLSIAQGNYDQALSLLQNDIGSKTGLLLYFQATAYAGKGDKEMALATLQQSLGAGFRDFAAIDASPYFSVLRNDPRFKNLIQRYKK